MKNRVLTTFNLILSIILVYGIASGNNSAGAANGQIKACAEKSSGALRLATKCRATEKRVTWNIRGPQGYPGENAYVNTKWVGLSYLGNPAVASPCGTAGDPKSSWSTYKVFAGLWINSDTLTSSSYWQSLTTCYITFKVIVD